MLSRVGHGAGFIVLATMLSGWVRFLGFGPRVRHVYVKRSRSSRAHALAFRAHVSRPRSPEKFSGENLPIHDTSVPEVCMSVVSSLMHACMHASGPSPTAPSLSALALRGAEISLGSRLLQLQTCLRAHCTVDSSASIGRPTGRCLAESCLLVCRIHESCACSCMRAIRATEVYSELTHRQLLERAVQRR